jgi:hypothetical protein
MKKELLLKSLALGIVILLMGISTMPLAVSLFVEKHISTKELICKSSLRYENDTTPPITTISFDPQEPNGENGWYVSLTVILNATDDLSGVKEIRYIYNGNHTIPGDYGTFPIEDGDLLFECWAIDNAGNEEFPHHYVIIPFDIDYTAPEIDLTFEVTGGNRLSGWDLTFTATATDCISGMNRVEFYLNNSTGGFLQKTVDGSGPLYQWTYHVSTFPEARVIGLIHNPTITDDYVKFFAFFVIVLGHLDQQLPFWVTAVAYDNAGNINFAQTENPCFKADISSGIFLFKSLTLPSNYTGYIGKFFISVIFDV